MRPRIKAELELLRAIFDSVEYVEQDGEDWFLIPTYSVPDGWAVDGRATRSIPVAFLIKADYPATAPYGFLTPAMFTFNGKAPNRTGAPPKKVPFPGNWLHFSWQPVDWRSTAEPGMGSNLVAWCRSFAVRLGEGI